MVAINNENSVLEHYRLRNGGIIMNIRVLKKVTAVTLAMTMALTAGSATKSDAKKKKPAIAKGTYTMKAGETATVKIKKNGNKIKKTTWKSSNKKVFTVTKKSNIKAVITGVAKGSGKVKATVVTNAGKKYKLSAKVKVKKAEERVPESEYWKTPDSPEIDAVTEASFEKAVAEYASEADYEPMALLGIHEDGTDTNSLVFARRTPVDTNDKTTYALVTIHETVLGVSVVSDIVVTDIEAYGTGNPDGWNETETPVLAKGVELIFQKAMEGYDGFNYIPLALLAKWESKSTSYMIISEFVPVDGNAAPTFNLVSVVDKGDGEASLDQIINLVEGKVSPERATTDVNDLSRGRYYVTLSEEARTRALYHLRKRGIDVNGNVLWDFTMKDGYTDPAYGFYEFINMNNYYDGWDPAYTFCSGQSDFEMTTFKKNKVSNYDILHGRYNFAKDWDEILIGWQMFNGKTKKADIQTRINNTISDDVYKKIIALNPDHKDFVYYGSSFIIYGYDAKKKQVVGKFIGVESNNRGPQSTYYFDVIGCDPNDKSNYGKRITEAVSRKSVNGNYD